MEFENILKLIKTVSDSTLTEFTYKEDSVKLTLSKNRAGVVTMGAASPGADFQVSPAILPPITGELPMAESAPLGNVISSPLVGTFYTSASPEEEPFVKVGDLVKKGQVLGIIEAMKLMNEVESDYDGMVEEILVDNESMVEYGQPLFVIK